MTSKLPKIIVIAGPTASGKTECGIELAEEFGGEIVSADSIQIYRHLDIGSAKPTTAERSRVPHHMIDIRDPDEDFSAGEYIREARRWIDDNHSRGMVPFVVGGTGLYIRLLLGGIVELPPKNPTLRHRLLQEEAHRDGILYERLLRVDPESARNTTRRNIVRIVRALEVHELTGRPFSDIQREHAFRDRPYNTLYLCIAPIRQLLYERIDMRVDSMIKGGLLDEVRGLYDRGFTRELKSMQSLGYRHAGMVLAGEVDKNEAIRLMKRDTRHFAKRQRTWFRSEPDTVWFDLANRSQIRFAVANFLGR